MIYDSIVIGSGPSGISCAIYLKRFNLNVLVIGMPTSALNSNIKIENYYGFDSISGIDLYNNGISQTKKIGIEVLEDEVTKIETGKTFSVYTPNSIFEAKTIYLATGKKRKSLNIKGLDNFVGKGISYCAICDGFLYRNKRIAVVGSGSYMKEELEVLKRFSKDVLVFSNGKSNDSSYINEEIVEFIGDDYLKQIKTKNNYYDVDACFIAEGTQDSTTFAKHLGIIVDEKNNIIVNNYQTNVPGLFAGGDAIGGLLQVSKAVSDGALASNEIRNYLKNN